MVINILLPFLDFLQKEMLLFASLCFLLGSADDLAFDGLWIFRSLKRRLFVYSRYERATVETLDQSAPDCRLAIFVPAWKEAEVIGAMLGRCLRQWRSNRYRIYVGCYPNDPATIAAVAAASSGTENIRIVICQQNGPTTKADCLNHLWDALCKDEIEEKSDFKAVVLHDAEDLVHPQELRLLGYLIGRAALVQLPVIPRRASKSRWVAGHYGDEFAELHGKQMVMREALGASIPSAGVGCAFARDALQKLAFLRDCETGMDSWLRRRSFFLKSLKMPFVRKAGGSPESPCPDGIEWDGKVTGERIGCDYVIVRPVWRLSLLLSLMWR